MLAGHVAVYQAGQGTMTLDGQSCDLDTCSFGPTENPETPPPPILEDGVFSAPLAGSLPQYDLMARQYIHGDNLTVYVLEAMPGKQLEEAGDVCGVRTTDPAPASTGSDAAWG